MGMNDPMNANDLLDYALGQLDGSAREHVERELAADPAATQAAERLTRAIHRLLDDGEMFAPPPGLAGRTVAFVAETAQGGGGRSSTSCR